MNRRRTIIMLAALATLGALGPAGCQTDTHAMSGTQPGVKPVCRECYELATQYRQWYPSRVYTGSRFRGSHGGETRTVTDRVHRCAQCKADVSFYTENGVQKIKCATCAPEGMACDLCAPPK